jgi:hypothetical protein
VTHASSPQDSREPSLPTRLRLAHLADAERAEETEDGARRRDYLALTGGVPPQAGYEKPVASAPGDPEAADRSPCNDKIERIRRRIEDGFYQRPDVQETIADRLADELMGSNSGDDN